MKRIYSMGKNKFITLDSYHASHETLRSRILQALFVAVIASITGSAMVGVDLIQLPNQEQSNVRSAGY
jgi:hypothetical protein